MVTARVTLWLTACAPVPPLAVTVAMKELVDGPFVPVEPPLTPLHPVTAPKVPARINNALHCQSRFFLGHAKRTAQAANVAPPSEPPSLCAPFGRVLRIAAERLVGLLTLSATVKGVKPSRLGCAGKKVHEEPIGSPEHPSVTAPTKPKPGPGVNKRFEEPGTEPEMVTFPGFAEILKSGLPTVRVAAPEVEPRKFASPE